MHARCFAIATLLFAGCLASPVSESTFALDEDGDAAVDIDSGGALPTLNQTYANGPSPGPQTISIDDQHGGIAVNQNGAVSDPFAVIDTSITNPGGGSDIIRITDHAILGRLIHSFRHELTLWGGGPNFPFDARIAIAPSQNAYGGLQAGSLLIGAQDGFPGSVQAGGPIILELTKGGGALGGVDGGFVLGKKGISITTLFTHAPWLFVTPGPDAVNTSLTGSYSFGSDASLGTGYTFADVGDAPTSSQPFVRWFVNAAVAAHELVHLNWNRTMTMQIFGYWTPLQVIASEDSGHLGAGMLFNGTGSGGHLHAILSRGDGNVPGTGGDWDFWDEHDGWPLGRRISLRRDGSVFLGEGSTLQNGNGGNESLTVGAAGAAATLPATPAKFLKVKDSAGNSYKIPLYNP